MNLVVAQMVDHAISSSHNDRQMELHNKHKKLKKMLPLLKDAFEILDTDGDGQVRQEELLRMDLSNAPKLNLLEKEMEAVDLSRLFEYMDEDDDGGLTEEEFVNGMTMILMTGSSIEIMQMT